MNPKKITDLLKPEVGPAVRGAIEERIKDYGKEQKINGAKSFTKLVRQMREKQKLYFDTRDNQALKESKALESQVDRAIHAVLGGGR